MSQLQDAIAKVKATSDALGNATVVHLAALNDLAYFLIQAETPQEPPDVPPVTGKYRVVHQGGVPPLSDLTGSPWYLEAGDQIYRALTPLVWQAIRPDDAGMFGAPSGYELYATL